MNQNSRNPRSRTTISTSLRGRSPVLALRTFRNVRFSNRRFGSSTIRPSTTGCLMSLAGSRFSSESALGPFHHGVRRRGGTISMAALPSDERQVQADIRTHLIHRPARDIIPLNIEATSMSNVTTKLKPKPIPAIRGSWEQLDDYYQQRARGEHSSEGVRVFFSMLALS